MTVPATTAVAGRGCRRGALQWGAMTEKLDLAAIVDDAAFFSFEHQLHLADQAERLGEHRWQADLQARALDLVGARTLRTTVSLLGSTAEDVGTWLWGWANPSGFSPEVTALGQQVAEFGRRHGVPELAEPELPLTPDIAARLTDATKVITGHWTSYSGEIGPGSRAYFLIDAPELVLPAPSLPRCARVIGELLSTGLVRDCRRALESYARLRGLPATTDPDGATRLALPDGELTVSFDELGRITKISGVSAEPPGRDAEVIQRLGRVQGVPFEG